MNEFDWSKRDSKALAIWKLLIREGFPYAAAGLLKDAFLTLLPAPEEYLNPINQNEDVDEETSIKFREDIMIMIGDLDGKKLNEWKEILKDRFVLDMNDPRRHDFDHLIFRRTIEALNSFVASANSSEDSE